MLTRVVLNLKKSVCIFHHVLDFDVKVVELKLTVGLVIDYHHKTFAAPVAKM